MPKSVPTGRKKKGFTFPELMISAATFLIISLILMEMLIIGTRYLRKAESDVSCQGNCMQVLDFIANDLRQAAPNYDKRTGGSSTGFLYLGATTSPTAVIYPNASTTTTGSLKSVKYMLFTKPDFTKFDPSNTAFVKDNPYYYKQIRYYTSTDYRTVYRETRTISSTGTLQPAVKETLFETTTGLIYLQFRWITSRRFEVRVDFQEDVYKESFREYVATDQVFIMSGE